MFLNLTLFTVRLICPQTYKLILRKHGTLQETVSIESIGEARIDSYYHIESISKARIDSYYHIESISEARIDSYYHR